MNDNTVDKDTNAFPINRDSCDDGMSLRDYFAAKAMQSLISLDRLKMDDVAEDAYKFADAMMEDRLK